MSGGLRAVEALRVVFAELHAVMNESLDAVHCGKVDGAGSLR